MAVSRLVMLIENALTRARPDRLGSAQREVHIRGGQESSLFCEKAHDCLSISASSPGIYPFKFLALSKIHVPNLERRFRRLFPKTASV